MDKDVQAAVVTAISSTVIALIGAFGTYFGILAQRKPTRGGAKTQRPYPIIIGSVLLIIGVSVLVYWLYTSYFRETETSQLESIQKLTSQVKQEAVKNKKYIMPSVTMLVELKKDSNNKITSDTRIVYQVNALQNIDKNDKVFDEKYSSSSDATVNRLPGSEEKTAFTQKNTQEIIWGVPLDLKAGQQRTIVTAAHREYPPTLTDNRQLNNLFQGIRANEEAFVYSNNEDAIGELVIMIYSNSLNILVGDNAACNRPEKPDGVVNCQNALKSDESIGSTQYTAVTARFQNPQPGTIAGVKVSW